jgi:hypothetical protein
MKSISWTEQAGRHLVSTVEFQTHHCIVENHSGNYMYHLH